MVINLRALVVRRSFPQVVGYRDSRQVYAHQPVVEHDDIGDPHRDDQAAAIDAMRRSRVLAGQRRYVIMKVCRAGRSAVIFLVVVAWRAASATGTPTRDGIPRSRS